MNSSLHAHMVAQIQRFNTTLFEVSLFMINTKMLTIRKEWVNTLTNVVDL